jgi:hypothetical protein
VTDGGTPPLSATNTFTVVVKEVNRAPMISPIAQQVLRSGDRLDLVVSATDSDIPANVLAYMLAADGPVGAQIDPTTGHLRWEAPIVSAVTTNRFGVTVTDSGAPPLANSVSFLVVVQPTVKLELQALGMVDGVFTLLARGVAGQRFTLEESADLRSWSSLLTSNSTEALLPLEDRGAALKGARFYRLKETQ